MNCGYSKEILALYVEDDLPAASSILAVESHVAGCAECRQYCDELRRSQAFIKSRFRTPRAQPVSQEILAGIRRSVMSQLEPAQRSLGWTIRLERLLLLGLRSPRYAVVAFVFLAVVSASLVAQIRHSAAKTGRLDGPVFETDNALAPPADYREWAFVGSVAGHNGVKDDMTHKVYMNAVAYQAYTQSGTFPEGAMMVLEDDAGMKVSVKDGKRFDGGWGFFEFAADALKAQPEVTAQNANCRGCHRDKAATDHVFTQFYPALRSGTAKL